MIKVFVALHVSRAAGEDNFDRRGHQAHRFNQKLLTLLRLQTAGIKNVITLLTVLQSGPAKRRRMIERLAFDVVVALESFGDGF